MKLNKIYFHIGLHKTGTSFLQRKVFPNIKELEYYRIFNIGQPINCKTLVSYERLSGNPISSPIDNRIEILESIKKNYPNAGIIVITRSIDWLKSLYSTYINGGGILLYNEWYSKIFNEEYLNQSEYIDEIKKRFDNVYSNSYENFKKDNKKIIDDICKFMDVEVPEYDNDIVNKRLSDRRLIIYRALNHLPIKPKHIRFIINRIKVRINE